MLCTVHVFLCIWSVSVLDESIMHFHIG
uniref:Uncharacterized protein n=1 Tax=Triticum urartu TaxID=4572 RepID=A0A8R7UY27_TRIUA